MVDVSEKVVTTRTAVAQGFVKMSPEVVRAVKRLKNPKGKPPGSGSDCWDCGGEEDGGVDTSLSPAAADAH